MKIIYIVKREWNVKGDTGHEIVSCHENYNDACFNLASEVANDMQYLGWLDMCEYVEARDEKGNGIKESDVLPEKLSYFCAQENIDWYGEYYEEYHIAEYVLYPQSTDSMSEK